MARLEDLIESVQAGRVREELRNEVKALKARTRFGLVFERHIPETICLAANGGLRVGDQVMLRSNAEADPFRVTSLRSREATIVDDAGTETTAPVAELLVVRRFGDPIYPTLTSLGAIERAKDRPYHCVIEGENYHALQLLIHTCQGQVDCIYIDPPYNTGARDWKYSNHYVDRNDAWRHSKWLAFMERRLRLAAGLLKPDGVLIVTVDAHEVHHLGMLLEQLFMNAQRQMVTICINPSGASGEGLSRVDEYALFCFFGGSQPVATPDDMLTQGSVNSVGSSVIAWESLLRRGNAWYRRSRPNLCYPVMIDPKTNRIVGTGSPFVGLSPARGAKQQSDAEEREHERRRPHEVDGYPVAWPVRTDGRLGIWRVDANRLMALVNQGYAFASSWDEGRGTWTIRYLMSGTTRAIDEGTVEITGRGERGEVIVRATTSRSAVAKTMWYRGRHTAGGGGGTQLLTQFLGERGTFPFPKSVYAVRDCLNVAVGDRRDALILDFFAGSGTTLHAACLLNLQDGGHRRTVLVTNNEVDEQQAAYLRRNGHFPGDREYEAMGIFEHVAMPRCMAAISGRRSDGQPVPGAYLDGREYAEGFNENAEFFRLDYLDPDVVELGGSLDALHPLMWLRAGARSPRPKEIQIKNGFVVVQDAGYAVLLDESALPELIAVLNELNRVRLVYLRTDSEDAYAEMCQLLGRSITTERLYGEYLDGFRRGVLIP